MNSNLFYILSNAKCINRIERLRIPLEEATEMVDEDINEGVLAMCTRKETFQEVCKKTNSVRRLN